MKFASDVGPRRLCRLFRETMFDSILDRIADVRIHRSSPILAATVKTRTAGKNYQGTQNFFGKGLPGPRGGLWWEQLRLV
jgi:hypothetical protein